MLFSVEKVETPRVGVELCGRAEVVHRQLDTGRNLGERVEAPVRDADVDQAPLEAVLSDESTLQGKYVQDANVLRHVLEGYPGHPIYRPLRGQPFERAERNDVHEPLQVAPSMDREARAEAAQPYTERYCLDLRPETYEGIFVSL